MPFNYRLKITSKDSKSFLNVKSTVDSYLFNFYLHFSSCATSIYTRSEEAIYTIMMALQEDVQT